MLISCKRLTVTATIELERLLKRANIGMSVDKVLNMAKSVTTITVKMTNGQKITRTKPMRCHQHTAKLFTDEFWGM